MNGRSMSKVVGVVLVMGASVLGGTAQAQLGARRVADPRVAQTLDAIGWKYQVDQDGDYVLRFGFPDQRPEQSQVVFIGSATTTLGSLEIRQVFAAGIISESPLDSTLLDELLAENSRVKVGGWCLLKNPQRQVALFAAQVAANADPRALATIVEAVAQTAQIKRDSLAARARGESPTPAGQRHEAAPVRPNYLASTR